MSKIARLSLLIVLSTTAGSACITGRAQTPADRPALEVPQPPERVIAQIPAPEAAAPALDPVEDLAPSGTKPASPVRNNKPPARPQPEPPKPEVKPEATTPPPADPAPQPATPQLKLPESADAGVVSRQLRDQVERTRRMLGGVDRSRLNGVRQKAYDDAQLFVKQAEDALNTKNLVFAKELADKAERLAKELQNR